MAFKDVAADRKGGISTVRLGNYLQAHEKRIEGGLKIVREGKLSNATLWAVTIG